MAVLEGQRQRRPGLRAVQGTIALLTLVVLVFAGIRVFQDVPNVVAGRVPDYYPRRYALHPVTAYLHIVPGVLYLLGAPLQLSHCFRSADYGRHRLLGRVLLPLALLSGVFVFVFGVRHPFGGVAEGSAAAVFGTWFLVCLLLALRAVRRGEIAAHRRWMVRAFAVGVGVGTIRLWLGLFMALGVFSLRDGFGPAFWIAFPMHVVAAELWLRFAPTPEDAR